MLALLLSLVVHAQEIKVPVVEGLFEVSSSYDVIFHMRWERVSGVTVDGKARLQELQNDGYTCTAAPSQTYNCTKHLSDLSPNEKLDKAVLAKWKKAPLTFYAPVGEPSLVNNTDFYKQFLVPQKVVLWDASMQKEVAVWNPISYSWTQGNWKMDLGSASDPSSYYVSMLTEGPATYITELMDFEKGWVRDRYFIKIPLLRTNPGL